MTEEADISAYDKLTKRGGEKAGAAASFSLAQMDWQILHQYYTVDWLRWGDNAEIIIKNTCNYPHPLVCATDEPV